MPRFLNRLFRSSWFPLMLRIFMLVAFVLLIAGGLAADTSSQRFAKILRNTNLANLLVWSFWWPAIILAAITLGRVWCTVCPMEFVTSLASRVGLKRKPPALVRSRWAMTIIYLGILVIGVHMLAIHRVPWRMAIYLLMLLILALFSGLLFARNTFCASLCPVGHLLGLYARLAPFGWGVAHASTCKECKDKSCVSRELAYRFQGRSCGVGLYPATLRDNTDCILCGQCMKACDQNNPGLKERPNPRWGRVPWLQRLRAPTPLTGAEVLFCLVVSGFVIYEVFTEWGVTKRLLLSLPRFVEHVLGITGGWPKSLLEAIVLFGFLPMIIWGVPWILHRILGGRLSLSTYLFSVGMAFIPVMAAAHALKSVVKMVSRIPYLVGAFGDPVGVTTAQEILAGTRVSAQLPSWTGPLVTSLVIGLAVAGMAVSFFMVHTLVRSSSDEEEYRRWPLYLVPLMYGGAFVVMIALWRL